jgi:hypothetical protein
MNSQISFLDCPAYMDADGKVRCGLPAEVTSRYVVGSTCGPVESMKIRCLSGHVFNGPIEFLTYEEPQRTLAAQTSREPSTGRQSHL